MMKKVLAFVLVLTLVLGMLPATAMAAEPAAQAAETTDPDAPYKVGYAKVDGNPYWSVWEAKGNEIPTDKTGYSVTSSDLMPLPMGGYGNNIGRLSKPKLVDDNGSGVGASHYNTTSTSSSYYRDIFLDDNATQNDGDGLWVTAVSIQQGNEAPVVIISVDVIGLSADYITYCKPEIVKQCAKFGLTGDRILINATHTHGSIDLGATWETAELTKTYTVDGYSKATFTGAEIKSYLAAFKPYLYNKMAEAALAALTEATVAEKMEKGTIDVSDATGYQLNGVRHTVGKQTADESPAGKDDFDSPEYVRGSSFNLDINGNGKDESNEGFKAVTPSDDQMHILRFTFAEEYDKDPVVLVNWRAHTTANNKMGTTAYYNLSSDFVSAMRYELEREKLRPMLIYGTSGNLGTGETGSELPGIIPSDYPSFYTDTEGKYGSFWVMPGTPYGRKLAEAALLLLEGTGSSGIVTPMTEATWGPIVSQSKPFIMEHREDTTDYLAYAAAVAHAAQVSAYNTGNSVGAAKLTSYPWVWCGTYADADGEVQVGTYVIASQYHANSLINKFGITNNRSFEINALLLGPNVAFATVPFEASDRYYNGTGVEGEDVLTAMQTQNDWDKLSVNSSTGKAESWGTPFVMSLVNGSSGYLPNKPAYNYSTDRENETIKTVENAYASEIAAAKTAGVAGVTIYSTTTYNTSTKKLVINAMPDGALKFVKGSYEAHTTFAKEGTGEKVVMALDAMLEDLRDGTAEYVADGQTVRYCPVCEKNVAWTVFGEVARVGTGSRFMGGHYYLTADYTNTKSQITAALGTVCLDLNGYTFKTDIAEKDSRALIVEATLNVMDTSDAQTGKVCAPGKGTGTAAGTMLEDHGGVILVKSGATLNLYGGTVENIATEQHTQYGAAVRVIGTFNMYDGTVIGGQAEKGGSVYTGGKFNMYGGTIKNGNASNTGGNICIVGGTASIYDGTVSGGQSSQGGNIYVGAGAAFNMYGGTVSGGKTSSYGGNVCAIGGTFNMYGGTITDGSAANSANYANLMINNTSTFRFNGGYIPSGAAMQGTMYLGSHTPQTVNTDTATVLVRNSGTVTLDGVFTGKVKLNYSGSSSGAYPTSPANGSTIGAVTPGSWIDHANGAKINATNTSSYVGVTSGELLVLGTKPTAGYCNICEKSVNWVALESNVFYGHYVVDQTCTGANEITVAAGNTVCLNLNGNTYTAAARAFTVNGTLNIQDTGTGGTLRGTAVASKNGGTVYVNAGGAVNQYSGTLTCSGSAKLANGGVVYVDADGSYTMNGGALTGGYATNGGNLYVQAGAEAALNNGTVTAGNATTAGGNVYTMGAFTMNGGSISGGTASSYGGNVHAQGGAAIFTMTGGTVSGGIGSSNICTGPNKSTDTSTFRMEGGSVTGTVYVQGYAVLTGSTTDTVNITVRVPAERLTIEGTYEGILNLTVNGATGFTTGEKIGNATKNADISGATITLTKATDKQTVAVVGNELQVAELATLEYISVTPPTKTEYRKGETLNTAGMVVTAHYSDGTTQNVAVEDVKCTGHDPDTVGVQTVTVTYEGKTATFEVEVLRELTGIAISTLPKTSYFVGEALDTTGLTLTATYNDGSAETITEGFTTEGFDSSMGGTKTVTVTYAGFTATFEVTVTKVLTGIAIENLPKTHYFVGDEADFTGLTLKATYNDSSTETITEGFTVTGFDSATAGNKTITVTYEGEEVTFTVTVAEAPTGDYVVGNTAYDDLESAMAASSDECPVVLNVNVDYVQLTNKDVYMDLNGHHVTAVSNNQFKLYCMDSVTDDFSATSGWGTAPKQTNVVAANDYRNYTGDGFDMIEGRTAGTKYYLALDEDGDMQSFHRIEMLIHTLNINVDNRGISYTASFKGDAKIQANIKEFGIAMRAYNAPNETYIWADSAQKVHVARTAADWANGTLTGVDVTGILTDTANDPQNVDRANVKIYGSCYIQFTDGTMLFSPQLGLNMHDVKYIVDAGWENLETTEQETLTAFFNKHNNVFGTAN